MVSLRRPAAYVAFGVATGWLLFLYMTGFCFSERRYITDTEFIERALVYEARSIRGLAPAPSHADVQAYLAENVECCRVEGADFAMDSSFMDRVVGIKLTWVRIFHPLSDEAVSKRQNIFTHAEKYVALDRCGRALKRTGEHLHETEIKKWPPSSDREIR